MGKNPHAVALGKLGGQARARSTLPEQRKQWAALGGQKRAAKYSAEQLQQWASEGGRPRKAWKALSPAGRYQRAYRKRKMTKERGK